ncbi:ATP synthase epsilon chain [Trichinella pseudospiralis]
MRDKLLVWNIFHVWNKYFLYKGSGYLYGPETVLRRTCEVDTVGKWIDEKYLANFSILNSVRQANVTVQKSDQFCSRSLQE